MQLERHHPGRETDLVYEWAKESARGAHETKMPHSVQIVARPWQEEKLTRIMIHLEEEIT